jgi:hypothetical protein
MQDCIFGPSRERYSRDLEINMALNRRRGAPFTPCHRPPYKGGICLSLRSGKPYVPGENNRYFNFETLKIYTYLNIYYIFL